MATLPGTVPRMVRPAPGQNYPRTGFPLEGKRDDSVQGGWGGFTRELAVSVTKTRRDSGVLARGGPHGSLSGHTLGNKRTNSDLQSAVIKAYNPNEI